MAKVHGMRNYFDHKLKLVVGVFVKYVRFEGMERVTVKKGFQCHK